MFDVTKSGKDALVEPGEEGGLAQRCYFLFWGTSCEGSLMMG